MYMVVIFVNIIVSVNFLHEITELPANDSRHRSADIILAHSPCWKILNYFNYIYFSNSRENKCQLTIIT
jgi:hypothetical protein